MEINIVYKKKSGLFRKEKLEEGKIVLEGTILKGPEKEWDLNLENSIRSGIL